MEFTEFVKKVEQECETDNGVDRGYDLSIWYQATDGAVYVVDYDSETGADRVQIVGHGDVYAPGEDVPWDL